MLIYLCIIINYFRGILKMKSEKLWAYAHLIAVMGINVMPGQEVIVRTAPEQLDFVEMVVEECYLAGASKVTCEWRYDPITCLGIQYQSDEVLGNVEKWEEERWKEKTEKLPANIYLESDDPDGFALVDQEKWAKAQQSRYKVVKPYRDAMENRYQWCVAAVPGRKWAKKVFPGCPEDEAVEKLWEAILKCSRAYDDPMGEWEKHDENLRRQCEKLNALRLRRLKYRSEKTGTDFQVGLMPQMRFLGGADKLETPEGLKNNIRYNANIPSEEVFTTPMKGDAEGIVFSTRPLSYRGVLIENFSIRFENGRAAEVHAEKNEEALKLMISMDEGAAQLGECALVPYTSPIRESGILFYSTLFDENASCHLALGDGYSICLENAADYTPEQARALGVNESMIHEDFMIGSDDLSIVGITEDGKEIQIFEKGEWAI